MREDAYIKETLKSAKTLSETISSKVADYMSDSLKVKDNKIVFDSSNVKAINNVGKKLFKDKTIQKQISGVKKYILNSIVRLLKTVFKAQEKYDVGAVKKSSKIGDMMEQHAIRNIDELTDLSPIYEDIRLKSVAMMSGFEGISLEEMRRELKTQIGEKNLVGKYWSRWTYDIYSQYQRAGGNELRKELGLVFAIFEGDLINTSREWCEDHAGEVYHISEIKGWEDEDWKGKTEVNYNPIIDLGGYNCRHQLRWISKELAKRLRPEVITLFPNEFE